MSDKKTNPTFQNEAPKYWSKNFSVVPVPPGTKRGIKDWNHYQNNLPSPKRRAEWMEAYSHCGIAILTGTVLGDTTRLAGIDIDIEEYVEPLKKIIGSSPCAKKGKKGLTIFVRVPDELQSHFIPKKGKRIVDVLVTNKLCVLPDTIHPETGQPYEWIGKPLYEIETGSLPYLDEEELALIGAILENDHHKAIMAGEGTHDPALSLVASLASAFDNERMVCKFVEAFLPAGYEGDLREELREMFRSARKKFGELQAVEYDPGTIGPIPLGYSLGGMYVFMHQKKRILAQLSPQSLLADGNLYDLAPYDFWESTFPKHNKDGRVVGMDPYLAADKLMQKCRLAGPFVPERVRGCGVWRDGKDIIINWRDEVPQSPDYTYVRFVSLPPFNDADAVDAKKLLDWLKLFRWEMPNYAFLALGWVALAPICGALEWRPHIFINGPKNSGKSTIIDGLTKLLEPMAIVRDGGSSEAGLRQTIGADSRPVILDEFESDQDVNRMRQVIKLARSASSAKGTIAKGTPEGKAMQFQLHSTFCFGAINPLRGTPADTSRIVNLSLTKHESDKEVKDRINEGLDYLRQKRGAWAHQMIGVTNLMIENIACFERAMPQGESRHNLNMATLIGAAYTALFQKAVSAEEAKRQIAELSDVVNLLAEAHEDDDSMECLNHLLCYAPDRELSVGRMIMDAMGEGILTSSGFYQGLDNFGIKPASGGMLVANKHAALDTAFAGTRWASGAWVSALRRLQGAKYGDELRTRFSGGTLQRCTFIPKDLLEEPEARRPF